MFCAGLNLCVAVTGGGNTPSFSLFNIRKATSVTNIPFADLRIQILIYGVLKTIDTGGAAEKGSFSRKNSKDDEMRNDDIAMGIKKPWDVLHLTWACILTYIK